MRFVLALAAGIGAAVWAWSRRDSEDCAPASGDGDGNPAPGGSDGSGGGDPPAKAPPPPTPTPKPAKSAPKPAPASKGGKAAAPQSKPKIAAAVGEPDDLTRIKGIGPKLSEMCQSLGVKRFDQIAAWSEADIAEVDKHLKIKGRITRDKWVEQAKALVAGQASD